MLRKLFAILFCLGVLLGSASAMASVETGSVGIMLGTEGEVTLYRVGDLRGPEFVLLERYGGETVTFDELLSPELAAWLAQEAGDGVAQRTSEGMVTFDGLEQGIYLLVQTAVAPGAYPFSPFLVTIPWDGGQWDLQTYPSADAAPGSGPKTGQDLGLLLAAAIMTVSGLGLIAIQGHRRTMWKGRGQPQVDSDGF